MSTIAATLVLLMTGLTIAADSEGAIGRMNCTERESWTSQEKAESTTQQMVLFNDWHYVFVETGDGNRMVYFSKSQNGEQVPGIPIFFNQDGRDNQALIIQQHTGHDLRFTQDGEKNRILIIQSDTLGSESSARVEQRGSGNRATIIQRNE